ncbi:MAG: hypothetical protein R2711_16460 [Acidimicrobiales bacterium]
MGFCFAPRYHGAMRHAGPTRKELGVPTVFNFLGPLANPARVRRQVTGVADGAMAARMVGVLRTNGAERAMVVYGLGGLDELTTTAPSVVHELRDGEVRSFEVDPLDLGIARPRSTSSGRRCGTNAALARAVLAERRAPRRHRGPERRGRPGGRRAGRRPGRGAGAGSCGARRWRAAAALERLVATSQAQAAADEAR